MQVGEVTGVMKQNIEKVLDRGDKLDDLVEKSDELQAGVSYTKLLLIILYNSSIQLINTLSHR